MFWMLIALAAVDGLCLISSGDTAYAITSAIFYAGAVLCWTGERIERAIERASHGSK